MSVFRYFHDQISGERRRIVRQSLIAFAVHPLPAGFAIASASALYSILGEQSVIAIPLLSLILSGVALFASIYLGFRSRVAAGRRAAIAGLCVIVGIVAGDLGLLCGLFSKVVA